MSSIQMGELKVKVLDEPWSVWVLHTKYRDYLSIKAIYQNECDARNEMKRLNALAEKKAGRPDVYSGDVDFYGVRKYRLR